MILNTLSDIVAILLKLKITKSTIHISLENIVSSIFLRPLCLPTVEKYFVPFYHSVSTFILTSISELAHKQTSHLFRLNMEMNYVQRTLCAL